MLLDRMLTYAGMNVLGARMRQNQGSIGEKDMSPSIEDIVDNFELLEDWEDRYRYLIELGRALPVYPDALRDEGHRVRGCASQVWLDSRLEKGTAHGQRPVVVLRGDSDAHIVRGLIAVVLAALSGRRPEEIAAVDVEAIFARVGLREHITPQRSNGLTAMLERIRADARKLQET